MADVLVIGAGMAGAIGALTLAQAGLKVTLASRGWGATSAFAGPLELAASSALSSLAAAHPEAGQTAARRVVPWTLSQHIDDMVSHQVGHPFALMGTQKTLALLHHASTTLNDAVAPEGLAVAPWSADSPCTLWPTMSGCLMPGVSRIEAYGCSTGSPWQVASSRSQNGTWGVLDLAELGVPMGTRAFAGWRYDAARFGLDHVGPSRLESIAGPWASIMAHDGMANAGTQGEMGGLRLAQALDDLSCAQRLARGVAERLPAQLAGLVVPPVMGVARHAHVMALWRDILKVPLIEATASQPSVPGVRLMLALRAALARAGVTFVGSVAKAECLKGRFAVATCDDGSEVHAAAVLLATGRFWGGGFDWPQGQRPAERLFGLPLLTQGGPLVERGTIELTRRRPEEDQPIMAAGLGVDTQLRPLTEQGRPLGNVFAAGLVLGGFSPRDERCSDGVAMATARLAALNIIGELQRTHAAGSLAQQHKEKAS